MPMLQIPAPAGSTPVDIHYQDFGQGKPVVLIHGWPLSGRSWEPQIPALVEAGHRVIVYDRRGFGASSQPWEGYDYDTFGKDLDALMTQLELSEATLIGFSMGGGELARYVSTYGSARVARLVFAAAVPPYLYKSADNPEGGLDDATIEQFQEGVKNDRMAFLEDFTHKFFSAGGQLRVSEPQRQYARDIASMASPKGTLDCIAAFGKTDFRADIAKITVPTLVIHGDADAIVPLEVSGARTHKAIAGCQLVVIPGGPHGLNVTHAKEFNQAVLDFLKG